MQPPSGEYFTAFGNSLLRVIGTLGVNRGTQNVEYMRDVGLVKNDNVVYSTQRRNKRYAFLFIQDGPARILDQAHGCIAVDRNNQHIAQSTRALQISQMSDMENVEAPICKHNFLSLNQLR